MLWLGYQERPSQIFNLVGWMLLGLEGLDPVKAKYKGLTKERLEMIIQESVKATEEAREDFEKSIRDGAGPFYLPANKIAAEKWGC